MANKPSFAAKPTLKALMVRHRCRQSLSLSSLSHLNLCLVLCLLLISACGGSGDAGPGAEADAQKQIQRLPTLAEEAKAESRDLSRMRAEARLRGVVHAVVSLEGVNIFSPDVVALQASRDRAAARLAAVLLELGDEVWRDAGLQDTTWGGFASMVVTEMGLDRLLMSEQVRAVRMTSSNSRMFLGKGNLEAIDEALICAGHAEVEVTLNVDAQDFDIGRDGRFSYRPSPEQQAQSEHLRQNLLARLTPQMVYGLDALRAAPRATGPQLRLRVSRRGFVMLSERPEVLAIRPVGWVDRSPLDVDAPAFVERRATLSQTGLEVMLYLREFPASGIPNTQAARQNMHRSYERVYDDIFAPLGAGVLYRSRSTGGHGGSTAFLTLQAYRQLVETESARLSSLRLNAPIGTMGNLPVLTSPPAGDCSVRYVPVPAPSVGG